MWNPIFTAEVSRDLWTERLELEYGVQAGDVLQVVGFVMGPSTLMAVIVKDTGHIWYVPALFLVAENRTEAVTA